MDADKIAAYGVAVAGVIAAVASFFLNHRKGAASDERADRKLVAAQGDKLFLRLLGRIESLEGRMTTLLNEHAECHAKSAAQQIEIDDLKDKNLLQQKRIDELERQLGKISREVK